MAIKVVKSGETGDLLSPVEQSIQKKKHNAPLPRKVVESFLVLIATGYAPCEAIDLIKDEFGVTLSPWQASYYNPDTVASKDLKAEYREFFYKIKRDFIDSLEKIPMSHAATRVKRLEDVYNKAIKRGDLKAATNALKESRIEMSEFQIKKDGD